MHWFYVTMCVAEVAVFVCWERERERERERAGAEIVYVRLKRVIQKNIEQDKYNQKKYKLVYS